MIRISTITRVIEDSVISAGSKVSNTLGNATRGIRTEYRARQISNLAKAVMRDQERLAKMSAAERRVYEADLASVRTRAEELFNNKKRK